MLFLSLKDPKKLHKMHWVKVAGSPRGRRRQGCDALILRSRMALGLAGELDQASPPEPPAGTQRVPLPAVTWEMGDFCPREAGALRGEVVF